MIRNGRKGANYTKGLKAMCADFYICVHRLFYLRGYMADNKQAVKMISDNGEYWELDVLGIPFGGPKSGKDLQGEFFDQSSNVHLDAYPQIPVVYYHGMDAKGKPAGTPEYLGLAEYSRTDERGHWFRALIKKTKELANRIWDAAKQNMAAASSGSLPHLVRVARNGHVEEWPVAELSLIDIGDGRQPANSYAVALPVMKAVYEQAGISLPDAALKGWTEAEQADPAAGDHNQQPMEGNIMDEKKIEGLSPDDVDARIKAALKAQADQNEEAKKAEAERQAQIAAEVEKKVSEYKAEAAKGRRLPMGEGAPAQAQFGDTWKYDHLSAGDLSLAMEILQTNGVNPSPAAFKALALKVSELKDENAGYVKGAFKAATGFDPTVEAIKTATDPMYTSASGYGSNWVGTAYSSEIWATIRAENQVVSKIPSVVIPDGYSSQYWPLEYTDPTWYKVAEPTAVGTLEPDSTITTSYAGTANKQMTLAKMGARVLYTGELVEDSLIGIAPQLKAQLAASGSERMEHIVIDGDTATSSNINDIGGTTYSGTTTTLFLFTNGFRDVALTTSTQYRAGGTLTIEDYMETLKMLGTNGIGGSDPSKCSFIVDPNVHYKNMTIPEVATRDVFSAATIENGFLSRAYGVEIIPSWQMHYMSSSRKCNSAGKIDNDTTTNNAYGGIVGVRWDQWKLGFKRRMSMEITRIARADAYEIVALARWGLAARDTVASSYTYGITV